jgi:hypothetical protein
MFQVVFLLTTILKAVEPSVLATPTTASDTLNPAMELFNRSHSAYSLTNGNYLIGLYEFNYEDARDTSPAGMSNNNNNDNNNNDNNNNDNNNNIADNAILSPVAYGNDGILSPGVEFITSGYVGGGILLNGNDHIKFDIDINPSAMPKLTMGGWVKISTLNAYTADAGYDLARHFLTHDNGGGGSSHDRGVGIDSRGGAIGWSAYRGSEGNGVFGSLPVTAGKWQFVAVVYDTNDNSVLLYVDGITMASTAKCNKGNTFLSLGKSPVENVGIQGSVDSVFVYNTALTINELSYLQKFAQEIIPPTASTGGYAVSTKEPFYLKTMPITTQSLARSSTQTIDGLSQLTISMWVKVNGLSNGQIMGLVEKKQW